MFLSAKQTAEKFGITVEKLEKIATYKTAPKGMVDSRGNYDIAKVESAIKRIERNARYALAHKERVAAGIEPKRSHKKSVPANESFEEFVLRFWETDDLWKDFVGAEANEEWMRYFIGAALEFGYKTAHPGVEIE